MLELNRQALTAYLTKTDAGKSTPFSKVNLGLGYLDVNASGYTQVNDPVPTPLPSVYTDAESQVWILEVERGEVQRRPHERFETVDSGDAEMIAELERSIYPLAMREGAGAFVDHLDVPPRDNFSFVIRASSEDAPIGYIIATRDDLDQSEIYIDDLAVLPEYQRGLWGPLAMGELFRRLSEAPDVERITLHARATTSYRAFSSERIRSRIEAAGWRVTRQEPQEEFYRDGEDAYYIELERIAA